MKANIASFSLKLLSKALMKGFKAFSNLKTLVGKRERLWVTRWNW